MSPWLAADVAKIKISLKVFSLKFTCFNKITISVLNQACFGFNWPPVYRMLITKLQVSVTDCEKYWLVLCLIASLVTNNINSIRNANV